MQEWTWPEFSTMPDSEKPEKRSFVKRRYLLDRSSQLSVMWWVLVTFAGIGVLYAFAVFVLLGSDVMAGKSIGEARLLLLLVQAGYFIVGGTILAALVLMLTHRFTGPAHLMRRAVEAMRQGDYTQRVLPVRGGDYLKELAQELSLLQQELAARAQTAPALSREMAGATTADE